MQQDLNKRKKKPVRYSSYILKSESESCMAVIS